MSRIFPFAAGSALGGFMRAVMAAAALAVAVPAVATAQERFVVLGADGPVEPIEVRPGFILTLRTDQPFSDLVVGNAGVADVFPLTDRSVYIQGNNVGATNVTFFDAQRQLIGTIILRVRQDFAEIERVIRSAVPGAAIEVGNVNGRIRLSGDVRDSADLQRVVEIASSYSEQPVINALRVVDPQQVQLDVRILEVNRSAGRSLGVNLTAVGNTGNTFTTAGSTTTQAPFGSFVGNLLEVAGTDIDVVINMLEGKGLARRLANPTLVTSNGVEANFVVGGEVPVSTAVIGENGAVATETDYREYGVRLNFRPVILDNNVISLRVTPEVSDVDFGNTVNGSPTFLTRKAETTVSLRDGQSFAIAGLLQVNNDRSVRQVPWLGQVPVLGALFRSADFQKRETDLVIVVTPRLVQPGTPNTPLASPLDSARSSNDVELFMLGMLEVNRSMIRSFRNGEGIVGPYGHMIDLEFDDALVTKK